VKVPPYTGFLAAVVEVVTVVEVVDVFVVCAVEVVVVVVLVLPQPVINKLVKTIMMSVTKTIFLI